MTPERARQCVDLGTGMTLDERQLLKFIIERLPGCPGIHEVLLYVSAQPAGIDFNLEFTVAWSDLTDFFPNFWATVNERQREIARQSHRKALNLDYVLDMLKAHFEATPVTHLINSKPKEVEALQAQRAALIQLLS